MLKTTNYEYKSYVLPEAVARVEVDTERGIATFKIGKNLDAILSGDVIEVKKITFQVDRNESPFITAYAKAKGSVEDPETGDIKYGILYGWEDYIIEE